MASNPENSGGHSSAVPWIATAAVALAALGLVAYLKTCQYGGKVATVITTTVKALPDAAAKFKTGTITNTFIEHNVEVSATKGDILEVATTHQVETFRREDSKEIVWGLLPLGTTTAEISTPVTFRYHIRLSDSWRLATRDNVCLVIAPSIRPSQPPAIHTGQMEKRSEGGWARFNEDENLADLERSMTGELEHRASDPSHRRLVREASRQAVAQFVKNWLLKEDRWRSDALSSIVVAFPDELRVNSDDDLEKYQHDPTVQLEKKNGSSP